MDEFLNFDWSFIDRIGDNPFIAMGFFLANGGWIILLAVILWGCSRLWLEWRQTVYHMKRTFVVLALDIPRLTEQGPRAVDNMFAYLAGAHGGASWKDKWIDGYTQDTISVELISIDGQIQFIIRTTRKLRDLIEAAVYAQYSDAQIVEVEDYAYKVPNQYPDEEWDVWGAELIPVKKDFYPLKTYPYFEDKVSMEFKDPLSALYESFGRLGVGEQAWFQIVMTPIAQGDYVKYATGAINKLTGKKIEPKKTMLDHVVDAPMNTLSFMADQVMASGAAPAKAAAKQPDLRMLNMTPGERVVVEAIENKMSKLVYLCKIRFVYVAKKTVKSNPRIVQPFFGSIKQFNTNNMQSLKPELKKVGISGALWFFKASRNNGRKRRLITAYRNRSNWVGAPAFHLCTEELASLWHFPHSLQVKAPQLKKTEAKRSAPPPNIPFG
ncbi:MAG: hypothetical protein WC551_03870 [Patescibacteria group bacterium]